MSAILVINLFISYEPKNAWTVIVTACFAIIKLATRQRGCVDVFFLSKPTNLVTNTTMLMITWITYLKKKGLTKSVKVKDTIYTSYEVNTNRTRWVLLSKCICTTVYWVESGTKVIIDYIFCFVCSKCLFPLQYCRQARTFIWMVIYYHLCNEYGF